MWLSGESMLTKIRTLIEKVNESGIRYCHWKSNFSLAETVSGQTDVDLLIHRRDASLFREILSQLSFRPARMTNGQPFPSVEHHYAVDDENGDFVHVHAYYRVITGESLTKGFRLPVEDMLLENTRKVGCVRVPTKGAELVIFTVRMLLKHTSMMELLLLSRYWRQARNEIDWLTEGDEVVEAADLVSRWLPRIDARLFWACVNALKSPAPVWQRVILGHRLRSRLRIYARHSVIRARLGGVKKVMMMLMCCLKGSQKAMVPVSGGAVIAFVGPEASGKSTLLSEISHWLSEHFAVERHHVGKPPATALSAIPSLLVPVLRAMLPSYRSTRVETIHASGNQSEKSNKRFPLIYGVRAVLLAYDRRSLLTKAFRRAANGTILLCDRYPSMVSGTPDSPQLSHLPVPPHRYSVHHLLARIEARLYREIPPPDMVIYLSAPLEVTVARNATRGKREPEDYVRSRHARSSNLKFEKTPVYEVNADQPFHQMVLEIKKTIWNAL